MKTYSGFRILHYQTSLLLVLALGLTITSCKTKQSIIPAKKVTIQYWEKWTGFEADAMQTLVDKYNQSQDKVYVQYLSTSQIDQKLLLATAGGNPPDVAGFWPHLVSTYSEKGALIPLDRLMKRDGIRAEDYLPKVFELCKYRGFTWGLPTTPATLALHYNKKLFRQAGLDPNHPPQTIKQLDEYADKLTKVKQDGTIIQLGFNPSDPGWWNPSWCYWFGGELVKNNQLTSNSLECIAAFEWVQSYPVKYGTQKIQSFQASGGGEFASGQNPFIAGKLAMQIQGVWMSNFIQKFNPDLEWGAAPFPAVSESIKDVTIVESDMLVIPKGSKHIEEAWDFIKFIQRQENMETLCLLQRKFTPLQKVNEEFYRQHPNPYIRTFRHLAQSPNAHVFPQISIYNEYVAEIINAYDVVWLRQNTPRNALQIAKERMDPKHQRALIQWERVKNKRIKTWQEL